jgi:hypothetical protein
MIVEVINMIVVVLLMDVVTSRLVREWILSVRSGVLAVSLFLMVWLFAHTDDLTRVEMHSDQSYESEMKQEGAFC